MTRWTLARLPAAVPAALLLTLLASPAAAQNGTLQGRVVNENGQPQRQVPVVLDQQDVEKPQQKKTVTDNQGDFVVTGMPGGTTWVATVVWGKVSGRSPAITIKPRETVRMPQLVVMEGGLEKAKTMGTAANVTKDEAAARAKRLGELEALIKEAEAAATAGNFDDALAKLTQLIKEVDKCAVCHSRIGDVLVKKKDLPAAEKAYMEAIAIDPNLPDPYAALATLYNETQRFDDAAKMASKANELVAAKGGGMDAASLYNQGVILWNQGKAAEAHPFFEKAVAADPKMAEAHYLLGMTLVNQGKLSEAKKPFEEYVKLAPNGPNAAAVKEMLKIIK